MGSQSRWGLTLPLSGLPLAAQQDLVTGLPELGYTDVWSAELNGIDGFTPLTLASQWAPQLRLGTAIVGIYTRAPVSLAVQAGTLAALAPGKFVMGIGTSSQAAVEHWNGIAFEKPYQRSRDMLRFLREALAGGKVTREYETFSVNGFRLDPAPEVPPALALAALRPGMLKLAAVEADMAITNWLAPKDVPRVRHAAGPDCELVGRIFVCPTTDADTARFIGKRMVAAYLTGVCGVPSVARARRYHRAHAYGLELRRPQGRSRGNPRRARRRTGDPRIRGGVPGARSRVRGGRSEHSRHRDPAGSRPRPRRYHS
jgi:probable F420-dependent oxidoreductase